ncbi:hypothetical protein Dimus_031630, partial [Dionaea muscipula]
NKVDDNGVIIRNKARLMVKGYKQKEKNAAGVDPSVPTNSIPDPLLQHFQAELDRARVDRLHVELDRARAENARLQALLQQATPKSKP